MKNKITINIITPESTVFHKDNVTAVVVPTQTGEITVLPNHIPLVAPIRIGEIRVHVGDEEVVPLAVSGGILEVRRNSEVIILAESSELAHKMDIEEIQKSYDRAKEALASEKSDEDDASRDRVLAIEFNKLQIANKWRGVK